MTEKERFLRQRQTYASRAQRNRSLFAIYQKKIEDEYLSSMSSMTMIFIIGLFAFTGFTAFKVNKSLAKSHMI